MNGHEGRGRYPLAQPASDLERLAVQIERLAQAKRLRRLLRGLEQVRQCTLPVLGAREVIGQHLEVLGKPIGVQIFDGETHEAVKLPAPLDEK